jgi:hypothetical protein
MRLCNSRFQRSKCNGVFCLLIHKENYRRLGRRGFAGTRGNSSCNQQHHEIENRYSHQKACTQSVTDCLFQQTRSKSTSDLSKLEIIHQKCVFHKTTIKTFKIINHGI